jgi:hypothetical protein
MLNSHQKAEMDAKEGTCGVNLLLLGFEVLTVVIMKRELSGL